MKLLTIFTLLTFSILSYGQNLDSKSATVTLSVAKFAKITNLDDFVLYPQSTDGDAGSIYAGSDSFNLESNTAVSVTLTGGQMSNGTNSIATSYQLDNSGGMSFDTAPGIHNAAHQVSAEATLGQISDQEAGGYSAQIVITVAAL